MSHPEDWDGPSAIRDLHLDDYVKVNGAVLVFHDRWSAERAALLIYGEEAGKETTVEPWTDEGRAQ